MKSPLPLLGLLALSCLFTLDYSHAQVHSAVTPAPRPDEGSKRRFEQLNERVKANQGAVELAFIGDSITQGWEGAGKAVWEESYAKRKAINLGIGGDRTQHVLWRFENGNLEGIKPKAAVIMIGTNNSNGEDNTPGQIAEGIATIVNRLREKSPETRILLLGIFPRGENFNPQRGKILQINQVIHKLADGKMVFFADIGHRFMEADGHIPASIMPDYLHLSQRGYEIWAEAIENQVARLLGEKQ
jgi:beta-glucosidase